MRYAKVRDAKEPSEASVQAAFFEWIGLYSDIYPCLDMCYAIPNGSHKSPAARGLFKRTGLKPGVPDVHLPVVSPHGGQGLWLEFKSKRGVLSVDQKRWIQGLREYGHRVEVVRSWTDAANVVIDYLALPIRRL